MALEDIIINEVIVEEEIQLDYRVGVDGVTFTPQVTEVSNEETILSFTNNGDKPNPEPTNIKGKAFTYDDFTPAQIASLQQPALDAAAIANAATNDVLEAEEVIQANEALRISAEIDRNDAEILRDGAEETRVTSEILREQSESIRKNAEILRNSSEVSRNNAELLRDSAEQTRINNEEGRVDAEVIRESNEDSRKANELIRIASESTRVNNELNRQQAEHNRTVAESDRVNAEILRESSEGTRESNEVIRQENEALRVSAENIRISNEGDATSGRVKAENDRVAAEIIREEVKEDMLELNFNPPKLFDISGRLIWHYWDLDTHAYVSSGLAGALNWRGTYSGTETYLPLDVVSYNESTWLCITESLGNLPTTAYFTPIAKGSYQYWLEAGNTGTYEDYLLWLDSKEPLLPATPDTPELKFLNGLRQWATIAIGAGGFTPRLYFTGIDSDISGYKKISNIADTNITELVSTITASEGEKFLRAYAYDDAIQTTIIDGGPWNLSFRAKVSNATGVTKMVVKAYVRSTLGAETLLFSADTSEINNTSYGVNVENSFPQGIFNVVATDRLVIKVYAKTTSASTITITTSIGDGDASYITTPLALRHEQLRDPNGDENYQHVTKEAQTFDGVKTFEDSPIVPTPTQNTEVANKKYVDDADALINTSINALKVADTKQQDSIQQIENTLNAININQEATATLADYGTLSLPKTAANGGMSVKLEGLTADNLIMNGNFATIDNWSSIFGTLSIAENVLTLTLTVLPGVGSGLLTGTINTAVTVGHKYYVSNEIYPKYNGATRYELGGVDAFGENTIASTWNKRGVIITATSEAANVIFYSNINSVGYAIGDEIKFRNNRVIDLTAVFGAGNEPDLATCDKMFANYFEGVKHFEAQGRIRSGNTALYINSPALRSNGSVKDEIRKGANGYEHVKRISSVDGSVLATPVITPIAYGGLLNSNSNGTVYREKVIADAGIYASGLAIQLTDYPISSFENIIKRSNGVETILNNATAVIAANGLSFTHPDLVSGDLVLFTYYFANESTEGKTTLTYYDSRYVIADTANGKFYKTSISSTNGVASIILTEV